jgi:hypothetical protein
VKAGVRFPGALSPAVKWLVHEADHPPPFSSGVENGGAIPPLPLLHVVVLNYLSAGTALPLPDCNDDENDNFSVETI